jgi:hypothetical protein
LTGENKFKGELTLAEPLKKLNEKKNFKKAVLTNVLLPMLCLRYQTR